MYDGKLRLAIIHITNTVPTRHFLHDDRSLANSTAMSRANDFGVVLHQTRRSPSSELAPPVSSATRFRMNGVTSRPATPRASASSTRRRRRASLFLRHHCFVFTRNRHRKHASRSLTAAVQRRLDDLRRRLWRIHPLPAHLHPLFRVKNAGNLIARIRTHRHAVSSPSPRAYAGYPR